MSSRSPLDATWFRAAAAGSRRRDRRCDRNRRKDRRYPDARTANRHRPRFARGDPCFSRSARTAGVCSRYPPARPHSTAMCLRHRACWYRTPAAGMVPRRCSSPWAGGGDTCESRGRRIPPCPFHARRCSGEDPRAPGARSVLRIGERRSSASPPSQSTPRAI